MIDDTASGCQGDPTGDRPVRWTVVLPFKGGPGAKSRLAPPAGLADAIALDCLESTLAAASVATVVVVTADRELARAAEAAGARVRGESRPGAGLPAAVRDGLEGLEGPCTVLLGDLPALRPTDLDEALHRAWEALTTPSTADHRPPGMVFVPDAEGTGTVLLAATGPDLLHPSFGADSARRHAAAGARRLDLELPRLRRDVDTRSDLATAHALGLGRRTRAFVPGALP